jgi:2-methoxy-6-polyprenyl-1,4-benzoquinol methylase
VPAPQDAWAQQIRDAGFKAVAYENLTGGVVAMHSGYKL